ncbi:LysR family transcriptional regulator [Lentzea sp. NPDC058436]|uniref:LysR family transcriptional regulator n=1 Tax=Lentzea sp. NPDC058436 TaxID=3346499 RepID=UPI00364F158E
MSEPVVDLDLRLVRYFLAVAEHGHFGRAAAALRVAQPSLSRQIHRLEHELGARLIDRTPQGSRLTEAGRVFLLQARPLVQAANQAVATVRASTRPARITVGYTRDLIVTPAVRELRHRHPDADVHTLHLGWNEPPTALLEHRVDAVVARMPFATTGLETTLLFEEPRVLVVSVEHRLAGKESVTLADIADEPIARMSDPEWNAFWRIDPRPDGRPAPDGPLVDTVEDKLELIAANQTVSVASAGLLSTSLRPDLAVIPIEDVAPAQVVTATRADDPSPLVTAFREIAQAQLTGVLVR